MQLRNLGVLQCRGLSRDVWLPGLRKFGVMTCPVNGKSELYKALEQDIVDGSNNKVVNTTSVSRLMVSAHSAPTYTGVFALLAAAFLGG